MWKALSTPRRRRASGVIPLVRTAAQKLRHRWSFSFEEWAHCYCPKTLFSCFDDAAHVHARAARDSVAPGFNSAAPPFEKWRAIKRGSA
ncbi:hypothetical protein PENTCL1PPCAC_9076, partial [Pristionchus entomophagus]